jgi:hypothetical protein
MKTENLNNQEVIQLLNFVAYKSEEQINEIMHNYERLISFLNDPKKSTINECKPLTTTNPSMSSSSYCCSGVVKSDDIVNYKAVWPPYMNEMCSQTYDSSQNNGACVVPTIKEKIDNCLEKKKINDPLAKLYVRELAIKDNVNSILERKLEKVFDEIDKEIGFTKEDYPVDPPNNKDLEFAYDKKLKGEVVPGYDKVEDESDEFYTIGANKLMKMFEHMENCRKKKEESVGQIQQETSDIDYGSAAAIQLMKYFGKNTPKEEPFWKIKKEESPKEQLEKKIDHAENEVKSLKDMINAFKEKHNLIEYVVTPKYD